eukprot:GILJ01018686.1.p1 GENE.GILJ01018686.1~~GILJ01018686.1.p1  ORF type:complete len:401 (-),score=18.20 GILJ01018686.1:101-1225(-)
MSGTSFAPSLAVANDQLHVTWCDSGATNSIHAAVFNENELSPSWTNIDDLSGNINTDAGYTVVQSSLSCASMIEYNGALHIAYLIKQSSPSVDYLVRVKRYDGANVWTSLDNDQLHPGAATVLRGAFIGVANNKIYVAWAQMVNQGSKAMVYSYNGETWTSIDNGGLLAGASTNFVNYITLYNFKGSLYLGWTESNNMATTGLIHIVRYGGNDGAPTWTNVDSTGIGTPVGNLFAFVNLHSFDNQTLYVTATDMSRGVIISRSTGVGPWDNSLSFRLTFPAALPVFPYLGMLDNDMYLEHVQGTYAPTTVVLRHLNQTSGQWDVLSTSMVVDPSASVYSDGVINNDLLTAGNRMYSAWVDTTSNAVRIQMGQYV